MKTYKLHIGLALLFLALSFNISAQKSLQKARQMKDNFDYAQAIKHYNDYFKIHIPSGDDAREVAETYFKLNDTRMAEKWLEKVVNSPAKTAMDVINYAHILRSNGKYEEAILQYKNYSALRPSEKEKSDKWIRACEDAQIWMNEMTYYNVINAEAFNSENSDFGLMPLGKGYVLTSDRKISGKNYSSDEIYGWTGNPYLKLFYFDDNLKPKAINDLNNNFHNGPAVFNQVNNTIYFTRTKLVKVKQKPINADPTSWIDYSDKSDYISRLEIYVADYNNDSWTHIRPFQYNNADEYSVGHPALSPCGKMLYFASDMPGGFGGTDIYFSLLNDDGSWSKPQNAGGIINTEGKEVFPYVAENGHLFFSSNGHPGMGGLDIFEAVGSKNKWAYPQNLKHPFNSPKDDFSIVFTKEHKMGYLSSDREGGKGGDDIYRFELLPPRNLTIVTVTKEKIDAEKALPLGNVTLEYLNKSNNTTETFTTNAEGKHIISGNCNEELKITAERYGFLTDYKVINTTCVSYLDTMFVELILDKIIIGKPYAIKNIFYNFDKHYIRDDAKPELDNIVNIMLENPKINIELGSHTDSRGTHAYNNWLSQKRAESAVAYIVSRGIDPSRITAKGYGETELVNACADGVKCSDEAHQMNRRTEFRITSIAN